MLNENHKSQEEYEPGFWQHPFIQNTLPFITSLVLHLSLIALGLATMQVVKIVITDPNKKMEITLGDPEWLPTPNPNPPLTQDFGRGDSDRAARQEKFPNVPEELKGRGETPRPMKGIMLNSPPGGSSANLDLFSGQGLIGIGELAGKGKKGLGTGNGDGIGNGNGDDDGLAKFGPRSTGPSNTWFPPHPAARRVAYVCDASGSMLNMFDSLRMEIRKSVDSLRPIQSFNLYFFQAQGVKVVDATSLMPAIPSNKQKAFDFMDKMFVASETNPIPALDLAFKHGADFIYLLTDGDFNGPGNEAVVKYCAERTKDGKKRISTIAYIGKESKDSQQEVEFVKALKAIAKDSGGTFRFVTDEDMGR